MHAVDPKAQPRFCFNFKILYIVVLCNMWASKGGTTQWLFNLFVNYIYDLMFFNVLLYSFFAAWSENCAGT